MSNFFDLRIDRSKIDSLLESSGYIVTPTKICTARQRNIEVSNTSQEKFILEIFSKETGGTTLVVRNDTNNIGLTVCELIKEKLKFFEISSVSATHIVKSDDFTKLLTSIKENFPSDIREEKPISGGTQYVLYSSRDGNLTLKYFDKSQKLQFQGKALKHFHFIYLSLIDLGYNINDSINEIRELYVAKPDGLMSEYMPIMKDKLNEEIIKISTASLQLLKVNANFSDGSIVLYPMIRVLEHVMRVILDNNGLTYGNRGFYMFGTESDGITKTFNETCPSMSNDCKKKLSKCYTFYYMHRHTLFHLSEELTEIRIININEAKELTLECVELIEEIGNEFY